MRVLIIDNYDSFTYNLVHQVEQFVSDFEVHRNDAISLEAAGQFDKILLSPGPGLPNDAGIMPALISKYSETKSILGICLGMQGIAEAFGGTLYNMPEVRHGEITKCSISDNKAPLFQGIASPFEVGHYHSWAVQAAGLPDCLIPTAVDEDGTLMALRHRTLDVRGVQFHPESVMTPQGLKMIGNWVLDGVIGG